MDDNWLVFQRVIDALQLRTDFALGGTHVGRRHDAFANQTLRPYLSDRGVRPNLVIEQRLSVRRLVAFVVSVTTIPHQIHEKVATECGPIRDGDAHGDDARFGIVGIHMDHRHFEPLREIARKARRARINRVRGESDLIVHDDVQRAAHRVATQVCEVERLGDDSFARERRVAVNADRDHRKLVALVRIA